MGGRFIVEGETCFVSLLTDMRSGQKAGLIIHGEQQMKDFCEEAISAFSELRKNKEKKKRVDRILNEDETPAKSKQKAS